MNRVLKATLLSLSVTLALNLVIYFVAVSAGWYDPTFPVHPEQGQPLDWQPIVVITLAANLIAGLVYWLLDRFTKRPTTYFYIIAGIVFLAFIFPPLQMVGMSTSMRVMLEIMHVTTAISIVYFLAHWQKSYVVA